MGGLVAIIVVCLISFIGAVVYDEVEMNKMYNKAKKEKKNKK